MSTVAAANNTSGFVASFRLVAADIKLAHSVFAPPVAVLGAFMAQVRRGDGWWTFAAKLGLVVLCMVLARTWAMLFNRLVDRKIDAANARTARRAFASGKLRPVQGWAIALSCAVMF